MSKAALEAMMPYLFIITITLMTAYGVAKQRKQRNGEQEEEDNG